MIRRTIIFAFLLLFTIVAFSHKAVSDFTQSSLLKNANVSLLVQDLTTGQVLYEYRPKSMSIPASTMKVVTTATVLELFGSDYRFETKLLVDGTVSKEGVLNGNLIIRGGGDPTLGSDKLGNKDFISLWVESVKATGIKRIVGRIVADESIFDTQVINPKWTWEDMGNYYAPGIHGISYLDNTYRTTFRSGDYGTTPEIIGIEPEIQGLEIENHLKSTSITYDAAYFFGAPNSNFRTIYGEIPANRSEFIVKGDIPNPALLLASHFQKALTSAGIFISEYPVVQTEQMAKGELIYTHYSLELSKIITEANVKSNNHFAEYLFKFIGTKDSRIGTTNDAIQIIRSYWKSKGLSVDQLSQYDGSGLSPCDAVSANFFVELLTYMKRKSAYSSTFFKSLPVSGGRGTLSNFLVNTPLQGKVFAKSGTIENVKCYAGYIELKKRTLVFSLMVNNPNGSSKQVISKMEDFLLNLIK